MSCHQLISTDPPINKKCQGVQTIWRWWKRSSGELPAEDGSAARTIATETEIKQWRKKGRKMIRIETRPGWRRFKAVKIEVNRVRTQMTDLENQLRRFVNNYVSAECDTTGLQQQQATSPKYNPPSDTVSASPWLAPDPTASVSTFQEQFSPTIRCYTRASSLGTPRGSALIVVNILRLTRPDGLAYTSMKSTGTWQTALYSILILSLSW